MMIFDDKYKYSLILKDFMVRKIDSNFTKTSDFIKKLDGKVHANYIYRLYEKDFIFSPTLYAWSVLSSGLDVTPDELLEEFQNYYIEKTQKNRKIIDK